VDGRVRERATAALGKLGQVEALLALARDEKVDGRVREPAAEALGRLGRDEEASPILLALARDEKVNSLVRLAAAEALGHLGQVEEAVSILLALGKCADARVLPDLERIAQENVDEDEDVRRAAQEAIKQIRQRSDLRWRGGQVPAL